MEALEESILNMLNITNSTVNYNISESTGDSSTSQMEAFPLPFRISLHILYNLVFVCGVLGNALVLYVIYSSQRMRTTTNYLLANLALADFIIASLCVPFTYVSITYGYWPFGYIVCKVASPFNAVGVLVSAFTLIALAVEKYVAIIHPLAPRLRKSQVGWIILGIWVSAGLISAPIGIVSQVFYLENSTTPICDETWASDQYELYYNIFLMSVQYVIPVGVLAFTYTRISCIVWGIQHERPMTGLNADISLTRNSRNDTRSRKAVLLTLAVIIGFTCAWLPFNLNFIITRYDPTLRNIYASISCHWLAMSHSFYNPIIYAGINTSFRNAFRDVYRKVLCCAKTTMGDGLRSSRYAADRSSFSTSMSTLRWKSYRRISFSPFPNNEIRRESYY